MLISVDIKKKKKHNTIQSKYFALELVIDRMGASEMARIHPDFVHQIMQPLKFPLLHYDISSMLIFLWMLGNQLLGVQLVKF